MDSSHRLRLVYVIICSKFPTIFNILLSCQLRISIFCHFLLLSSALPSFIISAASFSCVNYSGGSYSADFCVSVACNSYCSTHPIPEYCMSVNYVDRNYCSQIGGFPDAKCQVVLGVQPEWTLVLILHFIRYISFVIPFFCALLVIGVKPQPAISPRVSHWLFLLCFKDEAFLVHKQMLVLQVELRIVKYLQNVGL